MARSASPQSPSSRYASETFAYRGAEWHRKSANGVGFIYDVDTVVADIGDAGVSRFYVTPMLDQNISMTVTSGDQAGTYFYSQDERQSVRTLTDSSGAIVARYDYTAFGEPVACSPSPVIQQRYTYTGRELSPYSGNHFFRYRTYASGAGIFTARDPLGYVDGMGLYGAVFAVRIGRDPAGLTGAEALVLPVLPAASPIPAGLAAAALPVAIIAVGTVATIQVYQWSNEIASLDLAVTSAGAVYQAAAVSAEDVARVYQTHYEGRPPDLRPGCPARILAFLNSVVDAACHGKPSNFFNCRADEGCVTLAAKTLSNKACISARQIRENRCWGGGNEGHKTQMAEVNRRITRCWAGLKARHCCDELAKLFPGRSK